MATTTPTLLVTLTDAHTAWYLTLKGTAASGYGLGYDGSTLARGPRRGPPRRR